jgi:exodeoxyribonuclease-3
LSRVLVATWNVNSLKARMPRVTAWLEEVRPDVVCLQETKMTDEAFPSADLLALGYDSVHFGQGRWNGVAILSRLGIEQPIVNFAAGEPDLEARIVTATCGGLVVVCVYVPNGRSLDHEHYQYKLRWMRQLRDHVAAISDPDGELIVAGDFNIAPDDRDVWDPASLEGSTHVSAAERGALTSLCDWGLVDVLRAQHPDDRIFSWWDYRDGNFHKGHGMRIDLVLATGPVAARSTWSVVDRNARKGEQPSDHAPVAVLC